MDAAFLAFAVVFVAELGDKTQLVAMGMATRYSLRVVLTGVCLAYVLTQALAALLGGLLGTALPARQIGVVAGVSFLAFAVWTLLEGDDEANEDPVTPLEAEEPVEVEHGLNPNQVLASPATETVAPVTAKTAMLAPSGSLRIVLGIIGAMMLAEIGDKSMLATAAIAADRNPLGAWLGASVGIIASGCIAIFAGRFLSTRVSPRATRFTSAALFGVFGLLMLAEALR